MQRTLFQQRFDAWRRFHAANPQVFELFVRFALEAKASGRKHFGARIIGERIRWYCNVETITEKPFKTSDHSWPYYSRLAMALHPDLAGVFECRGSRFDASEAAILAAHRESQTVGV